MSGHTPGPWEIFPSSTGFIISKPNEIAIAGIPNLFEDHPAEANARLIAAAPDLIAALERMVRQHGSSFISYSGDHPVAVARAAIAKATGEAT